MPDLILLGIVALSALLGLFRGLLAMVLGIAGWLGATWSCWQFGPAAAHALAGGSSPELGTLVAGHVLAFVLALVAVWLLGRFLRLAVDATALGPLDRLLGLAAGALRGLLVAGLLVLLLGFTPVASSPGWQSARMVALLQPFTAWMLGRLPELTAALDHRDQSDVGKDGASGDNGAFHDTQSTGPSWPLPLPGREEGRQRPPAPGPSSTDAAQGRPHTLP